MKVMLGINVADLGFGICVVEHPPIAVRFARRLRSGKFRGMGQISTSMFPMS